MSFDIRHGDCREVMATLEADSIDAIVSDPPYGLSFMGKGWDHGVPGVEFWTEALRVAKPGAHLLAFGGTRTYHRLACAIEDAGWEVRDCIMWVYGSGFPKSLDVSKAIDACDAAGEQKARRYRFTAWVRSTGATSRQIDDATETNMGGHYTTSASQPAIMTREHLEACRHLFAEVPEWVERECDIRSVESQNMKARSVVGVHVGAMSGWSMDGKTRFVDRNITAPATDAARAWSGWGTALKPAHEPIILARKPLIGTVAANVLTHGTGAINVDGCRVDGKPGRPGNLSDREIPKGDTIGRLGTAKPASYAARLDAGEIAGRWPANLIHDGSEDVLAAFPDAPGQLARASSSSSRKTQHVYGAFERGSGGELPRGDSGSAARFFYCAKASKSDREDGVEGVETRHPTVKPTDLMRYLCRLVTPPNGLVLDPFTGSGSTGKAALLEGFRFLGIEREAEYVEIARARCAAAQVEVGRKDRGSLFATRADD